MRHAKTNRKPPPRGLAKLHSVYRRFIERCRGPMLNRMAVAAFYLGCLAVGAGTSLALVHFISQPTASDHLAQRLVLPGVTSWDTLTKVTIVQRDGRPELGFSEAITALNQKEVKLHGYITPLQLGASQKHFILSPKPPSCNFCVPAGPDEMVEVYCKNAVTYSLEPVVIAGTFTVLRHDPSGLFYRMAEAVAVPKDRL